MDLSRLCVDNFLDMGSSDRTIAYPYAHPYLTVLRLVNISKCASVLRLILLAQYDSAHTLED